MHAILSSILVIILSFTPVALKAYRGGGGCAGTNVSVVTERKSVTDGRAASAFIDADGARATRACAATAAPYVAAYEARTGARAGDEDAAVPATAPAPLATGATDAGTV